MGRTTIRCPALLALPAGAACRSGDGTPEDAAAAKPATSSSVWRPTR